MAAPDRIEIKVQAKPICWFYVIPFSLNLVLKLILLKINPFRLVEFHSFRMVIKDTKLVNFLPDMFLTCLCSHNHGLPFINVHLQVPDGFISTIRDHDNIFETCMLQIGQNDCQASGIRSVSR